MIICDCDSIMFKLNLYTVLNITSPVNYFMPYTVGTQREFRGRFANFMNLQIVTIVIFDDDEDRFTILLDKLIPTLPTDTIHVTPSKLKPTRSQSNRSFATACYGLSIGQPIEV
jgi:hypothetical protein